MECTNGSKEGVVDVFLCSQLWGPVVWNHVERWRWLQVCDDAVPVMVMELGCSATPGGEGWIE